MKFKIKLTATSSVIDMPTKPIGVEMLDKAKEEIPLLDTEDLQSEIKFRKEGVWEANITEELARESGRFVGSYKIEVNAPNNFLNDFVLPRLHVYRESEDYQDFDSIDVEDYKEGDIVKYKWVVDGKAVYDAWKTAGFPTELKQ